MGVVGRVLLGVSRSERLRKLVEKAPISRNVVARFIAGAETDDVVRVTHELVTVAVLDALLGVALGLFVSAFAATEFQVVQFMPALVLPQFLLCGLLVPRDEMPDVLAAVSNVLPLSYAVDAMREVQTAVEPAVWGFAAISAWNTAISPKASA